MTTPLPPRMTQWEQQELWDQAMRQWPESCPSIFAGKWTPGEDYPSNPGPEWLCGADWRNRERKAS